MGRNEFMYIPCARLIEVGSNVKPIEDQLINVGYGGFQTVTLVMGLEIWSWAVPNQRISNFF